VVERGVEIIGGAVTAGFRPASTLAQHHAFDAVRGADAVRSGERTADARPARRHEAEC
jgi:hypothetical protein